jgi:hypothetical protein
MQFLLPDRSLYRITASLDPARPKYLSAVDTGKASEGDLNRWFGGGGTAATGRTQFPSEEARDRAQAEQALAQAELARAQAANLPELTQLERDRLELDVLRAENDLKAVVYGQIGQATRTVFQAQEAERGRQQEMAGKDPFRFTATLRGRGTAGTTPTDVFKQQGAAFANQPIPSFSMGDPLSTLEAGLQGLQKMAMSQAPQGLIPGLAGGGVIEMERGGDGAFSMGPATEQTVLVGDGAGVIPGVTEALTVGTNDRGAFSVKVTPIVGGAQGGMSISDLDFGGYPDLLAGMRRSAGLPAGFGFVDPWSRTNPWSTAAVLPQRVASGLGAFQMAPGTLARAEGHKPVYIVDEQGRLRPYASREAFGEAGHSWGDIQEFAPSGLARMQRGPAITAGEPYELPPPNYEATFGALGQPLNIRAGLLQLAAVNPDFSDQEAKVLANRIGFLPAPHKIAPFFMNLDPTEQAGVLSLYELAGFPTASFENIMGAATPQAGPFGGRIGFTGGYM